MKKKIISALFLLFTVGLTAGFTGCSQDNYTPNEEVNILPKGIESKYVAPSGEVLFVDDDAFKSSTQKVLTDVYGEDMKKCSILDIKFSPATTGYVASIEYINPVGEEANYIMTNIPFTFEGGKLELEEKPLKYRNRLKSTTGPVKIKSLAIVPMDGNKVEIKDNEGAYVYSCGGNAVMKYDIR